MSTVNQYLAKLFLKNESIEKHFTDTQICDMMAQRFPGTAASRPEKIRYRRQQFNDNVGQFEGMNQDKVVSFEYDADGNQVPPVKTITRKVVVEGGVSAEQVQEIVDAAIEKQAAKEKPAITIVVPSRKHEITLPAGEQHKMFGKALRKLNAGVPVLLVGPAGSGKTTLASQLAKALGLQFTFNSMSLGTKETDILGRTLPDEKGNWVYRPSPFVNTYSEGGLHLFDELDAADPNLLVSINAAIANKLLSIPFRDDPTPIAMHDDAYIIAAANTFGTGANRMYVGRNQLDAATLNRFTMGTITIDYDRELETKLAIEWLDRNTAMAEVLTNWAWTTRERIERNALRRIMSTRNIIDAAKCLREGESMDDVKGTFYEGWSQDELKAVAA
jgi:cobaltochelatase CobS